MTLGEAIDRIDGQKHNICSRSDKIAWLSRLDGLVKAQILDTCEESVPFSPYHDDTPPDTCLLVQPPFDELYLRWLEARIDYANGEIERYNNAMSMFQALFDSFANFYRRNHMPKKQAFHYF